MWEGIQLLKGSGALGQQVTPCQPAWPPRSVSSPAQGQDPVSGIFQAVGTAPLSLTTRGGDQCRPPPCTCPQHGWPCRCCCSSPRVVAPHPVLVLLTPCCFPPCIVAGTLTKFTLVLYGTATESPSLSNQLESSGCKTLTPSQTCVGECGAGRGMGAWAPTGHADPVFPQSARRATTCTRRAA